MVGNGASTEAGEVELQLCDVSDLALIPRAEQVREWGEACPKEREQAYR